MARGKAGIVLPLLALTAVWGCNDLPLISPDLEPSHSGIAPICYGRPAAIYPGVPGRGTRANTVDYATSPGGVRINLMTQRGRSSDAEGDRYMSIARVRGSNFDDVLLGDYLENRLEGLDGNDDLRGSRTGK